MIPGPRMFLVERRWAMRDYLGLHFIDYRQGAHFEREYAIAAPVEMRPLIEDKPLPEPTILFTTAEAQGLMDQLWTAGIRPTEGAGTAGSMAAAQEHLKDMRRILFHLMSISKSAEP